MRHGSEVLTVCPYPALSVPYVPGSSTTAPCVLHGDGDPHSRGHPASEEDSGNRGCAGERAPGARVRLA